MRSLLDTCLMVGWWKEQKSHANVEGQAWQTQHKNDFCGNAGAATSFANETTERQAEEQTIIQAHKDQMKDVKRKVKGATEYLVGNYQHRK